MRLRYVLGAGLIIGAVAVISIVTFSRQAEAYYTVAELWDAVAPGSPAEAKPSALAASAGERMRVRGYVDAASVRRGENGLQLAFVLTDEDRNLSVTYHGLVPDTFDRAESVTVGGTLGADGAFVADELFVQCPSKYEAVPPGATAPAGDADGALDG